MELAITGVGIVHGLGIGREPFLDALKEHGETGTTSDALMNRSFAGASEVLEAFPDARTAEVWEWEPKDWLGKKGHRNNDRLTKFLITAARLALRDAGIKDEEGVFLRYSGERIGLASATAYGSLDAIAELNRVAELEDPRYINPTRFPNTVINAAAGYVSIWEGLKAPNSTIVDGNCGALDAVWNAYTHMTFGRADAMLLGGGEVVSEPLYVALSRLGVLRDMREDGFGVSMGEGSVYFCVEREDAAWERSATVHGYLRGYGSSFDPPQSEAVLVHAGSDAVQSAIEQALRDADISAAEVDAVACARSGLPSIDDAELHGIRAALGDDATVAAPKDFLGETFGAAGGFGLATGLAWLHGAPVGPRVRGPVAGTVETVVVLAVGFYGNVSAVVLTKD